MALVPTRPYNEMALCESTTAIGTTPVAATAVVSSPGYVQRGIAGAAGTTTGTITVAVTINGGSDIFGGALTLAAGAYPKNTVELPLVGAGSTSGIFVNEGDVITFTPSGGTSANAGAFSLVIRT